MTDQDVDLFCGAGGWGLAASALGLDPVGIELDDDACATHWAAGFTTLQADVAALDPLDFGAVRGLIASPPCQAWSRAGKRLGIVDQEHVFAVAQAMLAGVDVRARTLPRLADPRSLLIVEPLRWALALEPEWVALEQVPDVLPFWQMIEGALGARGYSVWTGKVNAADYGVPQTRERAVLLASRVRRVERPPVTHADPRKGLAMGYEPWVSMAEALGWGLSEAPAGTIVSVSPNGGPRSGALDGGSGSRRRYAREQEAGRWVFRNGNQARAGVRELHEPVPTIHFGHNAAAVRWEGRRPRGLRAGTNANDVERSMDEPAATLRFGERLNTVAFQFDDDDAPEPSPTEPSRVDRWQLRSKGNTKGGSRPDGLVRPDSDPAPTITSRADQMEREPRPVAYNRRDQRDNRTGKPVRHISTDEPAPTISGESRNDSWVAPTHYDSRYNNFGEYGSDKSQRGVDEPAPTIGAQGLAKGRDVWVHDRPATTVQGDPRIAQPGHKRDAANPDAPGRMEDSVRVSLDEAAVLQSFPPDYPWQGRTKTTRFMQVGNAVPPLLALRMLEGVV